MSEQEKKSEERQPKEKLGTGASLLAARGSFNCSEEFLDIVEKVIQERQNDFPREIRLDEE